MDIKEYQWDLLHDAPLSKMDQARQLARHLRFLTKLAQSIGYSLEELASLDKEEQ